DLRALGGHGVRTGVGAGERGVAAPQRALHHVGDSLEVRRTETALHGREAGAHELVASRPGAIRELVAPAVLATEQVPGLVLECLLDDVRPLLDQRKVSAARGEI